MELTMISDRALEIFDALKTSRAAILTLSNEIAHFETQSWEQKDELNNIKSIEVIKAATEISEQTGKQLYPNLTAQDAAVETELRENENYSKLLKTHRTLLKDIQVDKNAIVFQHELRGDLRTEADFLKSCVKAEVDSCGGCK